MCDNDYYIPEVPKLQIVICALLINFLFGCKSTYTDIHYQKLEDVTIGNGLTIHPIEKLVLISKPTAKRSESGKPIFRIFQLQFNDSMWCCETEVPFSSKFTDYHPIFSPDGQWVYYNSDRPIPASNKKSEKINIWRVKYHNGRWNDPEYLSAINTENHESYPTIAKNGTLYFNSDRTGGKGAMDIYKSEHINGQFIPPKPIVEFNSMNSENDMFIDPQERFIILNRYQFNTKEIELFIAYNKNGIWSVPEPIHSINKKDTWELTPTLSPDGKYLFLEINGKIHSLLTTDFLKNKSN